MRMEKDKISCQLENHIINMTVNQLMQVEKETYQKNLNNFYNP
jgi:hypothetical protein